MHNTTHTLITAPLEREILEGSLTFDGAVSEDRNPEGLNLDTDGLFDAVRAVLNGDASRTQIQRVIVHLVTDDFDYMSNDADDACATLARALADGNYINARTGKLARES